MVSTTELPTPLTESGLADAFRVSELNRRPRVRETLIEGLLFLCGFLSIIVTTGIVVVLGQEALLFFSNPEVSAIEFFTTFKWSPNNHQFGVWPLVTATLTTSMIAVRPSTVTPISTSSEPTAAHLGEDGVPKRVTP